MVPLRLVPNRAGIVPPPRGRKLRFCPPCPNGLEDPFPVAVGAGATWRGAVLPPATEVPRVRASAARSGRTGRPGGPGDRGDLPGGARGAAVPVSRHASEVKAAYSCDGWAVKVI
ncbi:hypothetical protein GCM10010341_63890 [Streptomyces noursei]|nr:hypothetical protein GCM10010341_63890 [Streptomyces noursei]